MNTNFNVVIINGDPYHLGLLNGYCHAHHYQFFSSAADKGSVEAIIKMRPDLVILAGKPAQGQTDMTGFEPVHEMSVEHQIPVCYLRSVTDAANLELVACWADKILDAPLDVNQFDTYLHNRFKRHPRFIREKRSRARRAAHDRRVLNVGQQNMATDNYQPAKNSAAINFVAGPFQIDQRSKCVLFNGKQLNLTRKEFKLFEFLAKDTDRVFMTEEIITYLWPENNRATNSDLYQYMHLLRKKIEHDPDNPQWILTVKGFGYKLNTEAPT